MGAWAFLSPLEQLARLFLLLVVVYEDLQVVVILVYELGGLFSRGLLLFLRPFLPLLLQSLVLFGVQKVFVGVEEEGLAFEQRLILCILVLAEVYLVVMLGLLLF